MIAAKRLRMLRNEAGLTQEQMAFLAGESRIQVHRRESNRVHLGPLRALVVLERALNKKGPGK